MREKDFHKNWLNPALQTGHKWDTDRSVWDAKKTQLHSNQQPKGFTWGEWKGLKREALIWGHPESSWLRWDLNWRLPDHINYFWAASSQKPSSKRKSLCICVRNTYSFCACIKVYISVLYFFLLRLSRLTETGASMKTIHTRGSLGVFFFTRLNWSSLGHIYSVSEK